MASVHSGVDVILANRENVSVWPTTQHDGFNVTNPVYVGRCL